MTFYQLKKKENGLTVALSDKENSKSVKMSNGIVLWCSILMQIYWRKQKQQQQQQQNQSEFYILFTYLRNTSYLKINMYEKYCAFLLLYGFIFFWNKSCINFDIDVIDGKGLNIKTF